MATNRSVYEQVIEYGLHLSDDFIAEFKAKQEISNNTEFTFQNFLKKILDFDLRKQPFVKPFFPHDGNLHVCQLHELCGPAVLQIVSVSNVSETSKRQFKGDGSSHDVYRIVLTDGHSKVTAFSTNPLVDLHTGTSPGTKVLLSKAKIFNTYLVLHSHSLKNIGGKVEYLHEAFLANQAAQRLRMIQAGKQDRSSSSSIPPPVFEPLSSFSTSSSTSIVNVTSVSSTTFPTSNTKAEAKSSSASVHTKTSNPKAAAVAVDKHVDKHHHKEKSVASSPHLVANIKGLSLSDKNIQSSSTQSKSNTDHKDQYSRSSDYREEGRAHGRGARGAGGRGRQDNRGRSDVRGRGRGRNVDEQRQRGGRESSHKEGTRDGARVESHGGSGGKYVKGRFQVEATSGSNVPSINLADTLSFPTLMPGKVATPAAKDWVCKNCTFSNNYLLGYCEICESKK